MTALVLRLLVLSIGCGACGACGAEPAQKPAERPASAAADSTQASPAATTAPVPAAVPVPVAAPVRVAPTDASLRYGGYFDARDPAAPRFAWPGTRIEAAFEGTSIAASFTDTATDDQTRENDWLSVVIDDAPASALALSEGLHEYVIASGLTAGAHRVSIWKRTEPAVGVVAFHGLTLAPGSSVGPPLPPRTRRMLFIGDSVTAGYGNEGSDATCHWSAATENNYATYGASAARALNAEYVAAAWSGKGLTRNYDESDVATLPALYRRVIPTDEASPLAPPLAVDVVVLNLGTNDFFRGVPSKRAFLTAYGELLGSLRAQYPGALIVMQVGPMLADDYPQPRALTRMRYWSKLARGLRRVAGDKRCELIEFWVDRKEGSGCDSHPSVKTHERLGRELAAFVRSRLAW